MGPRIRGTGELEAAFVLDVVHQVTPIEELHHKEQVVLRWGRGGGRMVSRGTESKGRHPDRITRGRP